MSQATEGLEQKLGEYRKFAQTTGDAYRQYTEAKRALKEREMQLYAEKTFDGTIDGKNAETREAQAMVAYKADPEWQRLSDIYRRADEAYANGKLLADIALMDLKVQAMLVNAEIAEAGTRALLGEVSLAGVS